MGKFSVPPFPGNLTMLTLVRGHEEVLATYRGWGKNQPKVLSYNDGIARSILGELWLVPLANEYDYFDNHAKGNPIGMTAFRDFVPVTPNYMAVRARATSPHAAKLWVLFNAGPVAHKIWHDKIGWLNSAYPHDPEIQALEQLLSRLSVKRVSWLQDTASVEKLTWSATPEGVSFQEQVSAAVRGQ
jgi:ABC-type Fe3+ transport system substrate-binding protein